MQRRSSIGLTPTRALAAQMTLVGFFIPVPPGLIFFNADIVGGRL
jgi:hypothetical protein